MPTLPGSKRPPPYWNVVGEPVHDGAVLARHQIYSPSRSPVKIRCFRGVHSWTPETKGAVGVGAAVWGDPRVVTKCVPVTTASRLSSPPLV